MQAVSSLIKDTLAGYLRDLPIPDSFMGWFRLGGGDWLRLVPFIGAAGGMGYLVYRQVKPKQVVNLHISKNKDKVVDSCDIEDISGDKACYCRCWRSKKFPLCDGSHNQHNKLTGDNVGPLIVKKKSE